MTTKELRQLELLNVELEMLSTCLELIKTSVRRTLAENNVYISATSHLVSGGIWD